MLFFEKPIVCVIIVGQIKMSIEKKIERKTNEFVFVVVIIFMCPQISNAMQLGEYSFYSHNNRQNKLLTNKQMARWQRGRREEL